MHINFKNESGKRYGRLLVLSCAGRDKRGGAIWRCRCDCGKEPIIPGGCLRAGTTKSCGCLLKESPSNKLSKGEAVFNQLYSSYKRHAKQRELSWELTKDEFRELTKQDCHYCGSSPIQCWTRDRMNGSYYYNGIDRIDNMKGYIKGNIVTCCKQCNWAKKDLSISEFREWLIRVYKQFGTINRGGSRKE